MSTNFYVVNERTGTELHFGKSSAGWVFSVRQYPELGLNTLYDWMAHLADPYNRVRDEYGHEVTVKELMNTVMNRVADKRGAMVGGKTQGEGSWDYNDFEFC